MTRGAGELSVTVVPDSGTDQLEGLAGKLTIRIDDGKHFYDFEYTLSETPAINSHKPQKGYYSDVEQNGCLLASAYWQQSHRRIANRVTAIPIDNKLIFRN